MDMLLDVLWDTLKDSLKLFPFLLLTMFLMELIEHRAGSHLLSAVRKAGRFGPALGALLGCIPQCGFSASCTQLFNRGLVSAGTLIAVFLSTSDEALPILFAHPGRFGSALQLLAVKLCVSLIAGFLVDLLWKKEKQYHLYAETAEEHHCDVQSGAAIKAILWEALKRTLSILLFLFAFSFVFGMLFELIGKEEITAFFLPGPLQPLLTGLFGFIPNCAASVLLTELYLDGIISFGSAVSGLCTAAGVGMLLLFRGKHKKRTYFIILGSTYIAATLSGLILQLLIP